MVGYWTDELDEWQVETNCEWSANRNFLTRSFKVVKDDQIQIQGVQVIGYDPIANTFRCWVFHSGGGFGEGTVEFQNDRFVLASTGDESQETQLGYYPIHRSSEGKWTIDTIGEVSLPVAQPSMENMKQLEWMVGQWVDQDENATIETTCSWTPNKAFLRRSFKVAVQDRVDLAGLQVIGWDADAEEVSLVGLRFRRGFCQRPVVERGRSMDRQVGRSALWWTKIINCPHHHTH